MKLNLLLLFFLIIIPGASAYQELYKGHYILPNDEIILFSGSSYFYDTYDKYGDYLVFYDVSARVDNIKNRYATFRLIHNGYDRERSICYNYDYCYIGNLKIRINHIFIGKEAAAVFLDIVKIYGD